MTECDYSKACKYYMKNCGDKRHQKNCQNHKTLDAILNRGVFKSRINKRIYREEHGHFKYEKV